MQDVAAEGQRPPMVMHHRSYGVGLLLAIVTLGLYGMYWHYKTHDELCRQSGRDNREKTLWVVHVVIYVTATAMALIVTAMAIALFVEAVDSNNADAAIAGASAVAGLAAILGLVGMVQIILFIIYVSKQYTTVSEARHALGLAHIGGAGWFFGWYYGGGFAFGFIGLPMLGPIIAYVNLQQQYNDLHHFYLHGYDRRTQTQPGATYGAPPVIASASSHAAGSDATGGRSDDSTAQAAAPAPEASEDWGRQRDTSTFRVGARGAPGDVASAPTTDQTASNDHVEQTFQCPRCHARVTAAGAPGATVDIACGGCGERGAVALPSA